jgi:hypothetical protein
MPAAPGPWKRGQGSCSLAHEGETPTRPCSSHARMDKGRERRIVLAPLASCPSAALLVPRGPPEISAPSVTERGAVVVHDGTPAPMVPPLGMVTRGKLKSASVPLAQLVAVLTQPTCWLAPALTSARRPTATGFRSARHKSRTRRVMKRRQTRPRQLGNVAAKGTNKAIKLARHQLGAEQMIRAARTLGIGRLDRTIAGLQPKTGSSPPNQASLTYRCGMLVCTHQ